MSDLPRRQLGRTELSVTHISYGALELRGPRIVGGPTITKDQAQAMLNTVLDAGINFIDTSNDYGDSEKLIGEFIAHRRKEYFLATKCGCYHGQHIWTKENIERGIDESLRRLNTDYVDILQFHNPPSDVVLREGLVEVLRDIQRSGKARFIGTSSVEPHISEFLNTGAFDTYQIPYSLLERKHEGVITKVAEAGCGSIIRGGAAKGALQTPASDSLWRTWRNARLDDLVEEGSTPMEFLVRYTFTHPDAHTVIIGTINPQHFQENIRALSKGPLAPDLYREAKRRLDHETHDPSIDKSP